MISRRRRQIREADQRRVQENEQLRRWVAARARALELEVEMQRRQQRRPT